MHAPGLASNGLIPLSVLALIGCREAEYVFTPGRGALGSGSDPERGSVYHDSRQNALPTYLSPGRAAKRKKTKRGGTYLLQGPLGRSKPDLPTCCIGCHRGKQTPYPGRSRNPGWRRMGRCGVEGQLAREWPVSHRLTFTLFLAHGVRGTRLRTVAIRIPSCLHSPFSRLCCAP